MEVDEREREKKRDIESNEEKGEQKRDRASGTK